MSFEATSGVTATRFSPGTVSRGTPIFMRAPPGTRDLMSGGGQGTMSSADGGSLSQRTGAGKRGNYRSGANFGGARGLELVLNAGGGSGRLSQSIAPVCDQTGRGAAR